MEFSVEKFEILRALNEGKFDRSALWIGEAKFGYSHLRKPISSLDANANILEVGCGSGILLSMLAEEFSEHNFNGIEPFGDGYSGLKELNSAVRRLGVKITIEGYEQHQAQSMYDLIYCVNVFEHVDDWRHFLSWSANNLKEGESFSCCAPITDFHMNHISEYRQFLTKSLPTKSLKITLKISSKIINVMVCGTH